MASNGSRKRRRKSKEKLQAVNDVENQDVQQKQKQPKQQEQQQHQQEQTQQLLHHHNHQQQQQQQQGSTENSQPNGQPLLTCIFDRLFLSHPSEMTNVEAADDQHTEGATCSSVTAASGHTDGVQKLLGDHPDVSAHVNTCFTALLSAVSWKHHNMVELLLQKGANIADVSEIGQNSLMIAAYNCDVSMMSLLWSYRDTGLDINAGDKDGNTALHHSTFSSCKEGVSFLLDRGADAELTNHQGKSALHVAASQGCLEICELLLKHLVPATGDRTGGTRGILCEDAEGKTPICEALNNQHLTAVKVIMEACSPQDTLEFYMKNIQKLSNLPTNDPSVDIQPILASLLFVVKRLQNDYLREMAEAETMQHLVHAIRHCITSPRVLSTACVLISVLVWKDSTEEEPTVTDLHGHGFDDSEVTDIQDALVQQFLDCRGPDAVMEKLSTQMFTAHDSYLIVSTLLPVMILASRASGRAWLEQNSGNLSFYKELLTRNKAFISHISLSNHSGLQVGHVIKTFLSFVEETEAKDREQNLAQLLEEEERDRLKRERKKRKRQKKHNKQAKTEVPAVADADLSTDDESGECAGWGNDGCRTSEIFSNLGDVSVEKEQSHLYYPTKHHRQQQQQGQSEEQYSLLHGPRHVVSLSGKSFPSEACLVSDKFSDRDIKWPQPVSISEEFPPISTGSEERTCSDTGEGWVKVEGRKQSVKPTCRQSPASIVLRPIKKQETTRPAPMRWADVAKIGCCRESGARNFTVLLANVARYPASEYYKMSVLSRNNTTQPTSELGESRNSVDVDGEDWQQIARNAFADNMTSKQTDEDQELAVHSSASSDSESDALSSTLSSECPSGQSDVMQSRKKTLSAADDFERVDANITKELSADKSDHYTFRSAFSSYHDQPRKIKSFIFDDANHLEDKESRFLGDGGKRTLSKRPEGDKRIHANEDKLSETAWSRAEAKPAMAFSQVWGLTTRAKSLDVIDLPVESSSDRVLSLHYAESHDGDLTLNSFPGSKTPPARSCIEAVDNSLTNIQFPAVYRTNNYYDNPKVATYLRNNKDTTNKSRPPFVFSFQKGQENLKECNTPWCFDKRQGMEYNIEQHPWLSREAKLQDGNIASCSSDMINVENSIAASQQQAVNCFMPSFASMASAVDNNPIVTSVVESVLTPTVISLSSLTMQNKPPTYSNKATEIPSPPPGFKFQKSNQIRVSNFDHTLAMLSNQATLISKITNPTLSTALPNQDIAMQTQAFSTGDNLSYDTLRQTDKQLMFGSLKSRSPMTGIVCPFSKAMTGNEESLISQQNQQQHQRQQQQYFQSLSGGVFHAPMTSSGIVQGVPGPESQPPGLVQSLYELPLTSPQLMPGEAGAESWADRFRSLALSTTSTTSSLSQSQFSFGTAGSSIGDFTTILSGRLHQRQTLRHQDCQHAQLKRLQQQYQDNQVKSFQEAAENVQRRYSDQTLGQQQRQQQYYSPTLQQSFRLNMKPNKASMVSLQQKQALSIHQHHSRPQQQQRLPSPPVLFPSDLRDEPDSHSGEKPNSPGFQDIAGNDLLSDLFADPLLVERIAINQIRQQVLASQTSCMMRNTAMSALRDSVYCNDLEYYASLYRLKLKDLLICSSHSEQSNSEATSADRTCGLISRSDLDKSSLACSRNHVTVEGRCVSPKRDTGNDRSSRRWREALNKILDTAWTMRHQFGDIVLPNSLSEFNISQVEYPLVLGFTTDGCEVAVLILEKCQAYIDPYLLDIMCDPELDHHFILKCKGMSETCNNEYIALDLCDYTLAEYMQIVQLSHRQDPLSANRLAWQLLEGLKFIHHNLSMPHGNLKPSWIFVDSEGRLRLAGYGIVTKHSGPSSGSMVSTSDRSESAGTDRSGYWTATEDLNNDQAQPSMASDIQVAGMLLYFILTGGQHPFGTTPLEAELNTAHIDLISDEANDLVSGMLFPDPGARPTVEHCLKHPFFWSSEKKFRLILIVGSDVLTEMKTGIALTGNGSPTMTEILSVLDIADVSLNWVQAINPTVMKEMRSFRVYKNSLSELTLFIYNCCLHFDKMSTVAKEVLDDPCKYFQTLFPSLFMAIYRSLKASDRTDRTCYKPFFS